MAKQNYQSGEYESSLIPKTMKLSEADLAAISRLTPDGESPLPTHLVLCDLCGQPIAGSSLSSEGYFAQEMKVGRHFNCHTRLVQKQQNDAIATATRTGAMPKWEDPNLTEDQRAVLFNTDDTTMTVDGRDINVVPDQAPTVDQKFYEPPKGSMPLSKVIKDGGLSANDPKNLPAPDNLPQQVNDLQTAAAIRDEEIRRLYADGDPGLAVQDPKDLFQ